MVKIFLPLLKTVRPRQWLKNLSLYAALIFSGFLFYEDYFLQVSQAFFIFTLVSSSVYILNDIADAPFDRKHPFKRKRPIASGELPIPVALFIAIGLLFTAIFLSWTLSFFFFLIILAYLGLNLLYTFKLKHVPIMDVFMIALGFILRVYAGAAVVNLHMNVWFLLTVSSLSLFLAVGKRQSERTLLKGREGGLLGHRTTLTTYTERLLDIYTSMFANATWFAYALYAFQLQFEIEDGPLPTFFSQIPRTFMTKKWLMLTVPFVIYGVMRYLQLVYEKNEGESPERVLLSDMPLLMVVVVWGISVILILYGLS